MLHTKPISLCVMVCFLLIGCSSQPANIPVNKTLVVKAGDNINQYNGVPNPVVLRIYQLSSQAEFDDAEFWTIFNNSSEKLAGVVINQQSLSSIYPGEKRLVRFELDARSVYLGAFVEFNNFGNKKFHFSKKIHPDFFSTEPEIFIHSSGVEIIGKEGDDKTGNEKKNIFSELYKGFDLKITK